MPFTFTWTQATSAELSKDEHMSPGPPQKKPKNINIYQKVIVKVIVKPIVYEK